MISEILDYKTKFFKEVRGDNWSLELLRPREVLKRTQLISISLNHTPLSSVSSDDYGLALIISTLKLAYRDGPDWFKKRFIDKTQDEYPLFEDFMDDEYLLELYQKFKEEEDEFEKIKKKYRHNEGGQKPKVDTNDLSNKDTSEIAY